MMLHKSYWQSARASSTSAAVGVVLGARQEGSSTSSRAPPFIASSGASVAQTPKPKNSETQGDACEPLGNATTTTSP